MKNIIFLLIVLKSLFCFSQQIKVAIVDFDNTSGIAKYDGLGKAMSSMLISDIEANVSPKRLQLVERIQINKILKEQNFQKTSSVDKASTVKMGKLLGVKYLLVGDIFVLNDALVINSRLVDAETGDIMFTEKQEGKLTQWLFLKTALAKGISISISMPFIKTIIPDEDIKINTITNFANALIAIDSGVFDSAENELENIILLEERFLYANRELEKLELSLIERQIQKSNQFRKDLETEIFKKNKASNRIILLENFYHKQLKPIDEAISRIGFYNKITWLNSDNKEQESELIQKLKLLGFKWSETKQIDLLLYYTESLGFILNTYNLMIQNRKNEILKNNKDEYIDEELIRLFQRRNSILFDYFYNQKYFAEDYMSIPSLTYKKKIILKKYDVNYLVEKTLEFVKYNEERKIKGDVVNFYLSYGDGEALEPSKYSREDFEKLNLSLIMNIKNFKQEFNKICRINNENNSLLKYVREIEYINLMFDISRNENCKLTEKQLSHIRKQFYEISSLKVEDLDILKMEIAGILKNYGGVEFFEKTYYLSEIHGDTNWKKDIKIFLESGKLSNYTFYDTKTISQLPLTGNGKIKQMNFDLKNNPLQQLINCEINKRRDIIDEVFEKIDIIDKY
jgi:TolB-like protein